jgi:hypothetical protein
MKTFFYMGHNSSNLSGVSWKIWKIQRKGRNVTVWWGPAVIEKRKPKPVGKLREKPRQFPTDDKAREFEEQRIKEKLRGGYKSVPRRKTTGKN